MADLAAPNTPCYSLRLVWPFAAVLREHSDALASAFDTLRLSDPDERIPVAVVHELLHAALEHTHDPDLGLKAARHVTLGDVGALDYLVSSCETVGSAIAVAARYMRLINDCLDIRMENAGAGRASLRLENSMPMPRAAVDFQAGALFQTHLHAWLAGSLPELEVWLSYAAPENSHEHERTFAGLTPNFSAGFSGFLFPRECLEAPLERADSRLHQLIQQHAERMLAELPQAQSFTTDVRNLLAAELVGGDPSALKVATRLGMSTRTLTRKLEREGMNFKELLDDLRRRLALQYLSSPELTLAEIALLLGFSQTAAFHRAFRRWTGQTPLVHRRAQGHR